MSENTLSFFQESDKKFVYKHLLSCYNKKIVCAEVGNYTGNSTRFFAENIPAGSTFYSVDVNMHDIDVPDTVIRVRSTSLSWNPPQLDFIYLDGNHNEDYVYSEIKKFRKVTKIELWVLRPWGQKAFGGALRVVCGQGAVQLSKHLLVG